MAFTTFTDYKMSANDLVTESLELLGVLGEGESPTTAQLASSIKTLNSIIKSWGADYLIFAQKELVVDLAASTGSYFFGNSDGSYIPLKIHHATIINTTTDEEVPLTPLTREEWIALSNKTTEGVPTQYHYQVSAVNESSTLSVWPVPSDTTYDIKLWVQYPLRDIDASTDDLYFSQEWYLALSFGLAYYLAPKYGMNGSDRDRFRLDMEELREEAASYTTDGSIYFQPELGRHG